MDRLDICPPDPPTRPALTPPLLARAVELDSSNPRSALDPLRSFPSRFVLGCRVHHGRWPLRTQQAWEHFVFLTALSAAASLRPLAQHLPGDRGGRASAPGGHAEGAGTVVDLGVEDRDSLPVGVQDVGVGPRRRVIRPLSRSRRRGTVALAGGGQVGRGGAPTRGRVPPSPPLLHEEPVYMTAGGA